MDQDLASIQAACWQLLVRGGADRRSPLHTPVVASTAADGTPDARVMVLRKADPATATLRFHTDARSPKCVALDGRPVSVLFYHPIAALQFRVSGTARVDGTSPEAEAAWAASTPFARRCYLAFSAPGTPLAEAGSGLPAAVEGVKPSEDQLVPGRANFALLWVTMERLDWLHLAQGGHRRAVFMRDVASDWSGGWVVP